mmetsp:Transcript_28411/g.61070  ORF Transcript_28411/g.61070 Transcript_28411/m.61070 type:complete len:239 (-) Transcript_28411:1158-1874(-)
MHTPHSVPRWPLRLAATTPRTPRAFGRPRSSRRRRRGVTIRELQVGIRCYAADEQLLRLAVVESSERSCCPHRGMEGQSPPARSHGPVWRTAGARVGSNREAKRKRRRLRNCVLEAGRALQLTIANPLHPFKRTSGRVQSYRRLAGCPRECARTPALLNPRCGRRVFAPTTLAQEAAPPHALPAAALALEAAVAVVAACGTCPTRARSLRASSLTLYCRTSFSKTACCTCWPAKLTYS